jgi:phage portal protein BeeE
MGIFDRVAASLETKVTNIDDYLWQNLFPNLNSKSGISVNVETALRTSTVLACGRVLSEGCAQLPIEFFEVSEDGKSKSPYKGSEVNVFTRRPNDWMTSFELIEQMTLHAVLTGNAFAYLGRG